MGRREREREARNGTDAKEFSCYITLMKTATAAAATKNNINIIDYYFNE